MKRETPVREYNHLFKTAVVTRVLDDQPDRHFWNREWPVADKLYLPTFIADVICKHKHKATFIKNMDKLYVLLGCAKSANPKAAELTSWEAVLTGGGHLQNIRLYGYTALAFAFVRPHKKNKHVYFIEWIETIAQGHHLAALFIEKLLACLPGPAVAVIPQDIAGKRRFWSKYINEQYGSANAFREYAESVGVDPDRDLVGYDTVWDPTNDNGEGDHDAIVAKMIEQDCSGGDDGMESAAKKVKTLGA